MTNAEKESKAAMVQRAVDGLIEHFDSVQIFTTHTEGGTTRGIKKGGGDFYARIGMAREFLIVDNERTRRATEPEDDEDDEGPESWQFL